MQGHTWAVASQRVPRAQLALSLMLVLLSAPHVLEAHFQWQMRQFVVCARVAATAQATAQPQLHVLRVPIALIQQPKSCAVVALSLM